MVSGLKTWAKAKDERFFSGLVRATILLFQRHAQKPLPTFPQEKIQAAENSAKAALHAYALERFLDPRVGEEYGLDRARKEELVERIKLITRSMDTATGWYYHLALVTDILNIPKAVAGAIVECGCYQGGSTCSLSLVAEITGRKLIVCDSFQGLPKEETVLHHYPHVGIYGYYKAGMYAGSLQTVRQNVEKFGSLKSCEFVQGFFDKTLSSVSGPLAFVFVDVDLLSSLKDCIVHLWPKLNEGGFFYTDDSCDMEVVRIWFDEIWWQESFKRRPPGYVGSGCGLPLHPVLCSLGYAKKISDLQSSFAKADWLVYPEIR